MEYKKKINKEYYDVIIIGSGIAGLTCGAELASEGKSVLVLEQHFIPGGATTMFKRNGFTFEGGGHRVSGIKNPGGVLYELLKKIKRDIKVISFNPSYVVKTDNKTFEASSNIDEYTHNLKKLFPNQKDNIDRFIKDIKEINNSFSEISKNKTNPINLITKHKLFIKYSNSTTYQFINDYFDDEEIKTFVTAVGNYTTLPWKEQSFLTFMNTWCTHHFGEGMSLIEGGTKVLVDALVDYIDKNNGDVVVSKNVEKILIENGKANGVRILDGEEVRGKTVVSTASNIETYFNLVGEEHLNKKIIKRIKEEKYSGALFQLFLGIKEGKGLENVTTFILGNNDQEEHFNKINKWNIDTICSGGVITVEGKENSPDGTRSINISALCPFEHPENWFLNGKDKSGYNKFKEEIAEKLIDAMTKYIPDLRERIIVKNTATPLTMYRYTKATNGGLQGLAHTVEQSGKNRWGIKSPVKNLYRAGQYVFPGAGIITVAVSGKMCAETILKEIF